MSRIHQLMNVQKIPASIHEVWAFFADSHNLAAITPTFIDFRMTRPVFGKGIYEGQVMTYTVRPLLGWPLSWMTEITHVRAPEFFVDEERHGPYRIWHHEHHFRSIQNGVEMTDLVHYQLPFGWLGNLAHVLIVRKKLDEIFRFRYERVEEIFGRWPEASSCLKID